MAYKRAHPLLFLRLGFPYSSLNPIGYKRKRKQNKPRGSKRSKKCEYTNDDSTKRPLPIYCLPFDVVTAILSSLPVKILQRFRCVCKSWDLLIRQDRCLASRHYSNSKQGLVSLSFARDWSDDDSLSELHDYTLEYFSGDDPTVRSFSFSQLQRDQDYAMTNCCDGLVGIYGVDSFYVANPSIRKMRALPRSSGLHVSARSGFPSAGLGFDASIGEYKLVRFFDRGVNRRIPGSVGCEVLYLGGNKTRSWKLIDDPPGDPSPASLPVVLNGVIHWKLAFGLDPGVKTSSYVILSFDLRQEKFGFITHPEGDSRPIWPRISRIAELGGCLCVADLQPYPRSSKHMNVWLLKDYRNSEWVKQYVIDLTKVYKPINDSDVPVQPLTIDNSGRIVLCSSGGRRDYYDVETRRFGKHERTLPHIVSEHVYPYSESIVWPWSRFCRAKKHS